MEVMYTAFEPLTSDERLQIMSRYLVPRPIAWIVTVSDDGILNIAPFAHIACVSSDPALLLVSFLYHGDGSTKDTLRNIRSTGKATLCSVWRADAQKMYNSSSVVAWSEARLFSIPCVETLEGYPPRVASATSVFLCHDAGEVPINSQTNTNLLLQVDHHLFGDSDAHYVDDVVGYYGGLFGTRHALSIS